MSSTPSWCRSLAADRFTARCNPQTARAKFEDLENLDCWYRSESYRSRALGFLRCRDSRLASRLPQPSRWLGLHSVRNSENSRVVARMPYVDSRSRHGSRPVRVSSAHTCPLWSVTDKGGMFRSAWTSLTLSAIPLAHANWISSRLPRNYQRQHRRDTTEHLLLLQRTLSL